MSDIKAIMLRLPEGLWSELKTRAWGEHMSLNEYLVTILGGFPSSSKTVEAVVEIKEQQIVEPPKVPVVEAPLEENIIDEDANKISCELCDGRATHATWADGEERMVCNTCIFSKHGKAAPSMLKRMRKL